MINFYVTQDENKVKFLCYKEKTIIHSHWKYLLGTSYYQDTELFSLPLLSLPPPPSSSLYTSPLAPSPCPPPPSRNVAGDKAITVIMYSYCPGDEDRERSLFLWRDVSHMHDPLPARSPSGHLARCLQNWGLFGKQRTVIYCSAVLVRIGSWGSEKRS